MSYVFFETMLGVQVHFGAAACDPIRELPYWL
jgi:hypothetical protein